VKIWKEKEKIKRAKGGGNIEKDRIKERIRDGKDVKRGEKWERSREGVEDEVTYS